MDNDFAWNTFKQLLNLTIDFNTCLTIFRLIKTHEDRIVYMMKLWKTVQFKPMLLDTGKTVVSSEAFRKEGNELYTSSSMTKEKYFEAFKLYSKSIAHAPMGSREQALAFANRSSVLCKMKKYVECLMDIERAIALNYPDAMRSKLYLRKIECLAALKSSIMDDAVEEANCWLNRLSINESNRTKFNDKLNDLIKKVPEEDNQSRPQKHSIPIIEKPNPEVPCASDAVAIKYDLEYGRHVVAARDIEPGEVLVVEKPYAMLLSPSNTRTHCYHCLEVCWAMIPCDSCSYAMYCSEECKNADWKASHDIECPVFDILELYDHNKIDLMSLRLTILAIRQSGGIENIKNMMEEMDKQTDMRTKGFSNDGIYHSNQYRSVCSLVTNTEKRDVHDLFRRTFDCCLTLFVMSQGIKKLIKPCDADTCAFVGILILRHNEIISSNAFSYDEEVGLSNHDRGTAVMPFLSLFNHACADNTCRTSAFGHLIVRALYPIEKGQQIFCNYGPYYALTPKAKRQKQLLTQYQFHCRCMVCREDWPLYNDIKSYKVLVASSAKRNTIAKALAKFNQYFQNAHQSHHSADTSDIIKDLLHMIRVLHDNAPMPCLEMNDVVETLKRYYALPGNQFEIPEV